MNRFTSSACAACSMIFAALANGYDYRSESYVGANVASLSYSDMATPAGHDLMSVNVRAGAKFDNTLSIEWRLGTGAGEEQVTYLGQNADLSIELFYGVYLLGGLSVTEKIYPYLMLGYTRSELELNSTSAGVSSRTLEENDVTFGVGVDVDVTDTYSINLEYVRYLDKSGVELSGPSLGFVYRF